MKILKVLSLILSLVISFEGEVFAKGKKKAEYALENMGDFQIPVLYKGSLRGYYIIELDIKYEGAKPLENTKNTAIQIRNDILIKSYSLFNSNVTVNREITIKEFQHHLKNKVLPKYKDMKIYVQKFMFYKSEKNYD